MSLWLDIALEIFRIGAPLLLAWYVANRPNTPIGRLARRVLAIGSPKPEVGETEHQFFMRYGFWSARWALQLLAIEVIGGFVMFSRWRESTAYQAVFEFMLPMLMVLAAVGACLLVIRGIYCDLRGTSRRFRMPDNAFVNTGNINR